MTSKERVRAAIQHQTPDRVPCSLLGVDVAIENLKKKLEVDSLHAIYEELGIDIWVVDAPYIGPELRPGKDAKGREETTHWLGFKQVNYWNGFEFNQHVSYYPMYEMETIEEIESYAWPNPDWFDYKALVRQCEENEDRALQIGWPGVFQLATYLRSDEKLYIDMAINPEFAQRIFDKLVDFEMEYYGRMFEAADGRLDILRVCDDYGTQSGLLFSTDMWDRFFARNTRRLADLCHLNNAFYLQHSCGAVRNIIPRLIDCGVDILDPIQKLVGMEPEGLKADFGDKLCFLGGIDTQNLLPYGTPEEVKAEAERFIEILNRDGGYILSSSQALQGDVPVENILALYAARNL